MCLKATGFSPSPALFCFVILKANHRVSDLQFPTNYHLKAKIWLPVACFILDSSDWEPPAGLTHSKHPNGQREFEGHFKSKGRSANCLKWQKCKRIGPCAAGKRKKNVIMTKKRRNAQNKKQHQPRAETGGEKRSCPWAGLLTGSEHPLTCVQEKFQPLSLAAGSGRWKSCGFSLHTGEQREEHLHLLQCTLFRLHAAARQTCSYFFWLNPVARHQSFCLTHQTKCRAIICHHKHNGRLLPNEGCSL